jgi:hypothetical protein
MLNATVVACVLGAGRVLIGLGAIFAVDPLAAWFGFPRADVTPTMRIFSRLFGNRDLGLGVLIFASTADVSALRFALLFNAAHDALDWCAILVPLVRRQGIRRPALAFLACATSGVVLFVSAWWYTFYAAA